MKSLLTKYTMIFSVAGAWMFSTPLPAKTATADTNLTLFQAATQKIVRGKVTDEKGKPLPGASIIVKGTHLGAVSDREGNFQIEVQRAGTLCISYIGRITQQIPFEPGNKPLNISLYTENNELERVVVVGYAINETGDTAPNKQQEEEEASICIVEVMPEFKGNLYEYLAKNIKYPVKALENNEEGIVYVSFIIDANGEVKKPTIIQSVSEKIDAEALRIVNGMPKWKPGMQRNQPVSVLYTLPIDFKIQRSR